MEKFNCAHSDLVELHKIIPNPRNPNKHPERQVELLAKIIDYQGQRLPLIISKRSGFLVSGHGRLMAIQKLGWENAAVDFQDFESEAQEFAHLIADNKIAELADHDEKIMREALENLDIDLESFDFELMAMPDLSFSENDLESKEMFEDFSERFNGESIHVKMIFEKELWYLKKPKIQELLEAKNLDDISQLFLWFLDGHN